MITTLFHAAKHDHIRPAAGERGEGGGRGA